MVIMNLKKIALIFSLIAAATTAYASDFTLGVDIGWTSEDESRGIYSCDENGNQVENTLLFKQLGADAIRYRVWVNPRDGFCSKEDVAKMTVRAKSLGMDVMIDFHYSDWWADPAKQNIPEAWKHFDYEQMKEALANHTRETLRLIKNAGVDVKWVQVGNETTHGFLWPMAKIEDGNMEQYAGLTDAGYAAVKDVFPEAQVIVHLDNGFDKDLYNRVFDGLKQYGCRWDIIGMSVYPFWAIDGGFEPDAESTLRDAIENIRELNNKYGCKVMIVETGVEAAKPEEGYDFLKNLISAAANTTNNACTGVFYWEPEAPSGDRGGYALGAFTKDRRPTKIMDAFKEFKLQRDSIVNDANVEIAQ